LRGFALADDPKVALRHVGRKPDLLQQPLEDKETRQLFQET
jgi:hypothetical protein